MIAVMSHHDICDELEHACSPGRARVMELQGGDTLFRQGDDPPGLPLLVDGRVDLLRWTAAGSRVQMHTARRGETFAEASLYVDVCHCDAVAAVPSAIRLLPRHLVLQILDDTPVLAHAFAAHLANALMASRRLLELRAIRPLTERVRVRLEELVDATGTLPENTSLIAVAADLDVTPPALYRAIAKLESAGVLARPARGQIRLLDFRARQETQESA